MSSNNGVVREGKQYNCYLNAATTTTPEARERVFKVVNPSALYSQLRRQSIKNKHTNYRNGGNDKFVYFGETVVRAYDSENNRVEHKTANTTAMIFISTDEKHATKFLRDLVLKDLKWAVSGGKGTPSRPMEVVKVSAENVGHVIGKRGCNLYNIQNSQRWVFNNGRKEDMMPSIHHDNELGAFILAANETAAVSRMKLKINQIVTDTKNKTWENKSNNSGGGAKTAAAAPTNVYDSLMSDSEDEDDSE